MLARRRIQPHATAILRRSSVQPIEFTRFLTSSTGKVPTARTTLAVIGGGLSGLSSAIYFLRTLTPEAKRKTRVVVFEKQNRVGGWCNAVRLVNGERIPHGESIRKRETGDTIVFETGPRSVRPAGFQGWVTIELAHFLGLTPDLLTVSKDAPSAKNRYLYTPPSLTLLPSSLLSVFKNLLENKSLMRRVLPQLLLEPFRPRSKLHTSGHEDESVDSFFSRRFGKPLAEEMISAMIHGIYAGDSRNLSVRAVFPQLWEAEREFGSVVLSGLFGSLARRKGWKDKSKWRINAEKEETEMQVIKDEIRATGEEGRKLVEAMEAASVWGVRGGLEEMIIRMKEWLVREGVELRIGEETGSVESIERAQSGDWRISTPQETITASHLITTLPHLLPEEFSPPRFPSTTVSVINLSFPLPSKGSPPMFPPGFGYLIPRTVPSSENPHRVLGVLFDSDVMPLVDSSAQQGLYKCSLILGGSYWLDNVDQKGGGGGPEQSHDDLVRASIETLRLHFPDVEFPEPVHAFTHTHRECIPQVPPNSRGEILAFSKRLISRGRGKVGVVGGGFASVGVNGAVKSAREVGTGFGLEVNELYRGEKGVETEKGEKSVRKGIKRAVRTGMEMWEV